MYQITTNQVNLHGKSIQFATEKQPNFYNNIQDEHAQPEWRATTQ